MRIAGAPISASAACSSARLSTFRHGAVRPVVFPAPRTAWARPAHRRPGQYLAAGRGHGCIVLLLDLSAAFDTIDHRLLLERLSSDCGISGTALAWFASYLHLRKQSVVIDGEESEPVDLEFGVPQGSVLGPKFYTIYVNALRKVVEPYGISIKQYSDDTTIYLEFTFPPDVPDQFDALRILSSCAGDLINWFTFNIGIYSIQLYW